jgi:hypothetical protein
MNPTTNVLDDEMLENDISKVQKQMGNIVDAQCLLLKKLDAMIDGESSKNVRKCS